MVTWRHYFHLSTQTKVKEEAVQSLNQPNVTFLKFECFLMDRWVIHSGRWRDRQTGSQAGQRGEQRAAVSEVEST